jgi:hypothetical protein
MTTFTGFDVLPSGTWDCGAGVGEWSSGGCDCGSSESCGCGGCSAAGCFGGGPGTGEIPRLPDYDGQIWSSPVRSVVDHESIHTIQHQRFLDKMKTQRKAGGFPLHEPAAVWQDALAGGVCMVNQGEFCCIEVLCHTLRRSVNKFGLSVARRLKAFKHCWLEVANCSGYTESYEVEPVEAPDGGIPGPKSNLVVGARGPAPRAKNGDVLPINMQKNDDIESRGWDCWACDPVEGGCLDPVCGSLNLIADDYPWYDSYFVGGPNSNTFVAYMANQLGMDVQFDLLDVGAHYERR